MKNTTEAITKRVSNSDKELAGKTIGVNIELEEIVEEIVEAQV